MKKRLIIGILFTSIFALPFAYTNSIAMQVDKELSIRIEEFYTLVYAEKEIETERWFTKEAHSPDITLNMLGGFKLLYRSLLALAKGHNGLASVKVQFHTMEKDHAVVDVELRFGDNTLEIIGSNEWRKENGLWKNDLYPGMKDSPEEARKHFAP